MGKIGTCFLILLMICTVGFVSLSFAESGIYDPVASFWAESPHPGDLNFVEYSATFNSEFFNVFEDSNRICSFNNYLVCKSGASFEKIETLNWKEYENWSALPASFNLKNVSFLYLKNFTGIGPIYEDTASWIVFVSNRDSFGERRLYINKLNQGIVQKDRNDRNDQNGQSFATTTLPDGLVLKI